MKKYVVGVSLWVLAFTILGCSSDTLDNHATNTAAKLDSAATYLKRIANALNKEVDAVKKVKKGDKKPKSLNFKEAEEAVKLLEKTAEELLTIDKNLPHDLTKEQKKQLVAKHEKRITAALAGVEKNTNELLKALERAKEIDPEATEDFRKKLDKAFNQFSQITNRHT